MARSKQSKAHKAFDTSSSSDPNASSSSSSSSATPFPASMMPILNAAAAAAAASASTTNPSNTNNSNSTSTSSKSTTTSQSRKKRHNRKHNLTGPNSTASANANAVNAAFPSFHLPPEWAAHYGKLAQKQQKGKQNQNPSGGGGGGDNGGNRGDEGGGGGGEQHSSSDGGGESSTPDEHNHSSGGNGSGSGGKKVFGPIPPPKPSEPTITSSISVEGSSSSGGPTLSATFGNIDLVTLANADFMNIEQLASDVNMNVNMNMNMNVNTNHSNSSNTNRSSSSSSSSTTSSKQQQQQQQEAKRDILLNYAAAAAAASGLTTSTTTTSGKSKKQKKNGSGGASSSSNTSGNTGSPPCSEADMKALMSMFVEIMGLSMDGTDGTGPNDGSNSNSNNNNTSTNTNTGKPMKGGAFTRENFQRMNMNMAAAAAAAATAASQVQNNSSSSSKKSKKGSGNDGGGGSSSGNSASSAFPVFSMMFGSSGGKSNTPVNMAAGSIPPPPGGWPPGAAAAAAAAVAAATGGTMGSGSGFPLGQGSSGGLSLQEWLQDYYEENEDTRSEDDEMDEIPNLDFDDDDVQKRTSAQYRIQSMLANTGVAQSGTHNIDDINDAMEEYLQNHPSNAAAAELLREEEELAFKQDEEEKAKRAAKKREKKNRKKEKAKREAAIKSAQASQKRREKAITSWKSRVVAASSAGDASKVESLLSSSPFKDSRQQQFDPEILKELDGTQLSADEEISQTMTWLLPSCIAKTAGKTPNDISVARTKLSLFVVRMAFHVVFLLGRTRRSPIHSASLIGDFSFISIVVNEKLRRDEGDEKDRDENIPNHCLDILCEDLGWSPLHFAVVGGRSDVVEALLKGGCNVHNCTEPTLTCRTSNGKGVTARDLGEFIRSGTYTTGLECEGESLQEVIDNRINGSSQSRAKYIATIESLIDRLHTVEKHGYSSLEPVESDGKFGIEKEAQKGESGQQLVETNKTKKKKKKKKGQSQEKNRDKNVSYAVSASTQEEVDPTVSTLLAMGFEEDKINAALDACGGSSRATVNDLVTSMLESSGSNDGENSSNKPGSENAEIRDEDEDLTVASVSSNPPRVVAIEQQEKALTQAKIDAAEATKRQAEAKAAADRLAAKREEQRRIRREWNNREQLRQKEEAKSKLAEEVERRRQVEIEKAKRAAQEHAAVIHLQNPILPNTISSQDVPVTNIGASLLFPTTPFQSSDQSSVTFTSQYQQPENNSVPKQPFDQPLLPPSSLPQSSGSHEYKASSITGFNDSGSAAANKSTPVEKRMRSTKKSSKKTSPQLEVNAFDFPQLGRQKLTPPTTPKTSRNKSQDSPTNGNISPSGKRNQKGKQKKNKDSPSKNKVIVHPTPQSHIGMPQASDQLSTSYESNPLGEIRATAREFVPSFAPSLNQKSSKPPQSLPPGIPMTMNSNTENDISAQVLQPMGALLPPNTSAAKQQHILTTSSILPSSNVTTSFERGSTSSPAVLSVSSFVQERKNLRHNDIHSPSASAASSVTGLSGTVLEETFSQHANSGPISFENNGNEVINHVSAFLDSNLAIGGAPTPIPLTGAMSTPSGLGILETNTNSLSGSNIWGGGTTSSAPSAFGFSSFNYGSENSSNFQSLGSNVDNSGSDRDERNEASHLNLNANMWGASSSANNGGGSIW